MELKEYIPIMFNGGSYGSFLHFVLDNLNKEKIDNLPFALDNGNSHNFIRNILKLSKTNEFVVNRQTNSKFIKYHPTQYKEQTEECSKKHSEFLTDVKSTVDFGVVFPENMPVATLFIRTDFLPTKLFRFNSESWVELDKALLKESAYSALYVEHLIEKINEHDYDNVLLDAVVAEGVDNDSVMVFNDIEIKHITEFKP